MKLVVLCITCLFLFGCDRIELVIGNKQIDKNKEITEAMLIGQWLCRTVAVQEADFKEGKLLGYRLLPITNALYKKQILVFYRNGDIFMAKSIDNNDEGVAFNVAEQEIEKTENSIITTEYKYVSNDQFDILIDFKFESTLITNYKKLKHECIRYK